MTTWLTMPLVHWLCVGRSLHSPVFHFSQLLRESNTYSQGHSQHIKSHGTISTVLCI